jgi:hypothetical protein
MWDQNTTSEVDNRQLPLRIDLLNARRADPLRALCLAYRDLETCKKMQVTCNGMVKKLYQKYPNKVHMANLAQTSDKSRRASNPLIFA